MDEPLPSCSQLPIATGIGLRAAHHERVRAERPDIAWLEVHTENFLGGGATPAMLEALRERYAISLHGVGLSLGSAEGLDEEHLARIAALVRRIDPGCGIGPRLLERDRRRLFQRPAADSLRRGGAQRSSPATSCASRKRSAGR